MAITQVNGQIILLLKHTLTHYWTFPPQYLIFAPNFAQIKVNQSHSYFCCAIYAFIYLIDLFSKYVSLKEKKPMFDPRFLKTYQRDMCMLHLGLIL